MKLKLLLVLLSAVMNPAGATGTNIHFTGRVCPTATLTPTSHHVARWTHTGCPGNWEPSVSVDGSPLQVGTVSGHGNIVTLYGDGTVVKLTQRRSTLWVLAATVRTKVHVTVSFAPIGSIRGREHANGRR